LVGAIIGEVNGRLFVHQLYQLEMTRKKKSVRPTIEGIRDILYLAPEKQDFYEYTINQISDSFLPFLRETEVLQHASSFPTLQ
jgi:hypothetical protein